MSLVDETSNLSRGAGSTETGTTQTTNTIDDATPPITSPIRPPNVQPPTSAVYAPVPTRHQIDASVGRAKLISRLVTPTSDLSAITKNFGSDSLTAGNTTSFNFDSLNQSEIPRTLYLDKKGDFASIFSDTNKAVPNTYNLDNNPTPIQNIPKEGDGFTNYGIVPNRYGYTFLPQYSQESQYPTIRPILSSNSRLVSLHERGRGINFGFGFTRRGMGLDEYYAQVFDNNGVFGIRNDNLNADDQPYIIRGIGERWEDTSEFTTQQLNSIIGSNVVKDTVFLKGASAREANLFTSRYRADMLRISKFGEGSVYADKQSVLQGRNRFDAKTMTKYELSDIDTGNKIIDVVANALPPSIAGLSTAATLELNPRVYNPSSIFTIPGEETTRMGMGFTDAFNLSDQKEQAFGIIKNIGERTLEMAAEKATNFVVQGLGNLAKKQLGRLGDTLGKSDERDSENVKALKGIFSNIKNDPRTQDIGKKLKGANDARKAAGLLFAFERGPAGKAALGGLNKAAFQDLNVDKVNLIKYGEDSYKDVSYENLDWIPFKFVDARNDKPIVFRAILSGISDTFTPEYVSERYVGRPDNVYVYQGTTREIGFTFDVYPKSDAELVTLWEKLNYLAGLTYPHLDNTQQAMVSPFTKLTIGDMYRNAPGIITSLTYTVQDNTTWETVFAKLPKYIQVSVGYQYIGNHLPIAEQKHYDPRWLPHLMPNPSSFADRAAEFLVGRGGDALKGFYDKESTQTALGNAKSFGLGLFSNEKEGKDMLGAASI